MKIMKDLIAALEASNKKLDVAMFSAIQNKDGNSCEYYRDQIKDNNVILAQARKLTADGKKVENKS